MHRIDVLHILHDSTNRLAESLYCNMDESDTATSWTDEGVLHETSCNRTTLGGCQRQSHASARVVPQTVMCVTQWYQLGLLVIAIFFNLSTSFTSPQFWHSLMLWLKGDWSPACSTLSSLRPHFLIFLCATDSITCYNLDWPKAWLEVKWTLTEAEPQLTSPVPSGAEVLPAGSLFLALPGGDFGSALNIRKLRRSSVGKHPCSELMHQFLPSVCIFCATFQCLRVRSMCLLSSFMRFYSHMVYFLYIFQFCDVQYFIAVFLEKCSGLVAPPGRRRF